jgi:hypothetical protein
MIGARNAATLAAGMLCVHLSRPGQVLCCDCGSWLGDNLRPLPAVFIPSCCAVKSRIKSVQNIKKITSAMKMVAASKMRKAQAAQMQALGMPTMFLKLFGEHTSASLESSMHEKSCAIGMGCSPWPSLRNSHQSTFTHRTSTRRFTLSYLLVLFLWAPSGCQRIVSSSIMHSS